MLNAFDPGASASLDEETRSLIGRRQSVLGKAYRLFYERPVQFTRGRGVRLYDAQGNEYLDAYNNVASVGHCHPRVVEAIATQAAQLNTHTRYLHPLILDYAEKLLRTLPPELGQAMFTCTGSEANDLALRAARKYTERTGVIVTQLAYHGVTASVAEVSPSLGAGVPLSPSARCIAPPDSYRQPTSEVAERLASEVRHAIADMQQHGMQVAALLVDTIFSSDGVYADPAGFLAPAVAEVRRAGGLFIADEVQAGFARTGCRMWGFQRHGLVPDLVTMGKPMGNGHPIGGVVGRPAILDVFGQDSRYFNTFGGNPVSCAAALAVLQVIEQEGLQANAAKVGTYLRNELQSFAREFECIGDVRGDGLFIGVELVRDRERKTPAPQLTSHFVNGMRDRRVLTSATGIGGNVVKVRPPLPFTVADADHFLTAARSTLASLPH